MNKPPETTTQTYPESPTRDDYFQAMRVLEDPDLIRKIIQQFGEETLGKGSIDDIAYLIKTGVINIINNT